VDEKVVEVSLSRGNCVDRRWARASLGSKCEEARSSKGGYESSGVRLERTKK
jgi:hypothetical protein